MFSNMRTKRSKSGLEWRESSGTYSYDKSVSRLFPSLLLLSFFYSLLQQLSRNLTSCFWASCVGCWLVACYVQIFFSLCHWHFSNKQSWTGSRHFVCDFKIVSYMRSGRRHHRFRTSLKPAGCAVLTLVSVGGLCSTSAAIPLRNTTQSAPNASTRSLGFSHDGTSEVSLYPAMFSQRVISQNTLRQ